MKKDNTPSLLIFPTTGCIVDDFRSVISATTCGGIDFDDLVTGRAGPYYTFRLMHIKSTCKQVVCAATHSQMDPEHTATNTEVDQDSNALHRATDTLVKWVDDTITDIEIESGKKVVKFYIGKTSVSSNKRSKGFDAMNPNTWRKGGIRSHWRHHKQEDYGRNGMVVLTVVTKDDVPQQSIPAFKHQEMYALALEQQLIIHYAFIRGDERLANISTHPGMQQQEESRAIGYPIYMAFALDDSETDLSEESDMEEPHDVLDQTKLQNQDSTEEEEKAIYVALGDLQVSPFGNESQKTLQPAHNRSSSEKRHVHFSNEVTKHDHVTEPESPSQKRTSSDDGKAHRYDLTQSSTQHEMVGNSVAATKDYPNRNISGKKRQATEIHEDSSYQKEKQLDEHKLTTILGIDPVLFTPPEPESPLFKMDERRLYKHQLETSNPQHTESVLSEVGYSKEMPIVIDGSLAKEQIMQLQNQDNILISGKQ